MYPSLNDNLQHNTPKWYHKNVIYELATIKNSIDTVEQDISIGFEMKWWRYGPFVRGVEKDLSEDGLCRPCSNQVYALDGEET